MRGKSIIRAFQQEEQILAKQNALLDDIALTIYVSAIYNDLPVTEPLPTPSQRHLDITRAV